MGQLAFKFFAGGVAGLLAWTVTEPSAPLPNTEEWSFFEIRLMTTLGLLVGLAIGGINGWLQGSRRHAIRGLVLGGVFGAMGAYIGYQIGGSFAHTLFGDFPEAVMPIRMAGRTLAGAGIGAGVGLGIGASGLTLRRTIQGLLGGLLGGVAGGVFFDPVSTGLSATTLFASGKYAVESGQPGRVALCVLVGAGVGLLIGAVQAASRTAWVRLHLGKKEGKEWVLDTQTAHIGRDERAQVPLFGDMNVAPLHCSIVRQGDAYWIYDAGTPNGTFLNGQRVTQAPLLPGTMIQVGSFSLEFQLRAGSAPARAAERMRSQPMMVPQVQQPAPAPQPVPQPVPVAAVGPSLVVISGPLAGQRFPMAANIEIGREGQQIQLPDAQASRKHARISMAPTGPMVEDLGSTNGTFVNGQRVSTMALKKGDVLKIGQSEFRVEL